MYTEEDVSIIVCTRDRPDDLRHLLQSISALYSQPYEVLLADNSLDGSASEVVRSFLGAVNIRYFHVPKSGKCHGLNVLLDNLRTKVCLFTDDDVRVPPTWLQDMLASLNQSGSIAVQGEIHIPKDYDIYKLNQSERKHLTEIKDMNLQFAVSPFLIGANMAVAWHRCTDIRFDEKTGPGAYGYMDDTLLSLELTKRGETFAYCSTPVSHFFSTRRITHVQPWLHGKKHAQSAAYVHVLFGGDMPRFIVCHLIVRGTLLAVEVLMVPFKSDRLRQSLTARVYSYLYLYYILMFSRSKVRHYD